MTAIPIRVGVLLFDGFDLLDVTGPYEVLLTTNRIAERRGLAPPFEVVTLAPGGHLVHAHGGLGVLPTMDSAAVDHLDVFVVPGTVDVDGALADIDLIATVATLAAASTTTTSVCTGAFLLAAAGLLVGRPATTHHQDVAALGRRPDVGSASRRIRWVDDGDIVTGAGLASSLSFGLHLVDRYAGRELALATAVRIEHAWDPDGRDVAPR